MSREAQHEMRSNTDESVNTILTQSTKENQHFIQEAEKNSEVSSQTRSDSAELDHDTDALDDDTDEDDGLSDEARAQLQRNTTLNDATDADEYDVKERLDKANRALAEEYSDDDDGRETRVNFKKDVVDLEIQPSSSSDDDEQDTDAVTNGMGSLNIDGNPDTVEISGQFLRRDEKVLVEIGGRFHVVEAGELEKTLPLPERKERPSTAETGRVTLPPVKQARRAVSAKPADRGDPVPLHVLAKATPTFRYPEETKKMIKKQIALKAKQEAEDEKRRKKEEDMARKEADEAWKSWVEQKNHEIMRRRKREEAERRRQERANWKNPDEIDEAYRSWTKQKMTQIKRERILTQQEQIERDEGWYLRERRDCNRSFRIWLRNKNEAAQKAKMNEVKLRRRSIHEMRKARKAQKLMEKIREAQQMKYVDYYGYRI